MKFAIPVTGDKLCAHFGHCEKFALVDADRSKPLAMQLSFVTPPPHEPGLLPGWLEKRGVRTVITGGMGRRAQHLFAEYGLEVVVGAPPESPEKLVSDYLDGSLQTGENTCDH